MFARSICLFISLGSFAACAAAAPPPASKTVAEVSAAQEREFATMPGGASFPVPILSSDGYVCSQVEDRGEHVNLGTKDQYRVVGVVEYMGQRMVHVASSRQHMLCHLGDHCTNPDAPPEQCTVKIGACCPAERLGDGDPSSQTTDDASRVVANDGTMRIAATPYEWCARRVYEDYEKCVVRARRRIERVIVDRANEDQRTIDAQGFATPRHL